MSEFLDPIAVLMRAQTFQSREQRVSGVVTAKVERVEDDGTYRLRFFGMNPEGGEGDTSAPARVMMPMAGARRGIHFFPEPGDEVVVAFHDGDTNTPIILGGVWNRSAPPPGQAKQSADNDVRTIVSRSGHELTFDDTRGSEKVTIRTQGGHTIELDDAPAGPRITMSSHGGARTVVLDDTPLGTLSLRSPSCQITMREPGSVSIDASARIELNAPIISLNAVAVTVGSGAGASTIDGIPFRLHTHGVPTPVTPPVTPV